MRSGLFQKRAFYLVIKYQVVSPEIMSMQTMLNGVSQLFLYIYACMHVRRRGQEFEKKQGQGSRGELEEGKGMEGNDPGEERSIPDAGERQAS